MFYNNNHYQMYLDITNGNVYAWRAGDSLQGFVRIRSRLAMLSFFMGLVLDGVFLGRDFYIITWM